MHCSRLPREEVLAQAGNVPADSPTGLPPIIPSLVRRALANIAAMDIVLVLEEAGWQHCMLARCTLMFDLRQCLSQKDWTKKASYTHFVLAVCLICLCSRRP